MAPNKNIEEVVEAFHWYHKTINPLSRLVVIGSERSCPRYAAMLRMLASDLNLPNAGFEGFASPGGLPTYYRNADLFVTASRHEGYCLPLLEAMHYGVPVLARATGGIPEAVNGSGCLYDELAPAELAGLMHRLISDPALRGTVLESQKRRMDEVRRRNVDTELDALLEGLA
jgi:glycosyltransferase involved in cell wall biosynthesis